LLHIAGELSFELAHRRREFVLKLLDPLLIPNNYRVSRLAVAVAVWLFAIIFV
jgi:hypothetical protein